MGIPKSYPMRFTPKGVSDAFDSTDKFPGACRALTDLIFDQANPEIVVARPGVGTGITSFSGFTTPSTVTLVAQVAGRAYGFISSALFAGHDQPFSYNIATATFDTITGMTSANTPVTQATTGAWIPPTVAGISTKLIFTHPGFTGVGIRFGVLDITTPSAPTWIATDLATNALPSVPNAVANFNNRAYFACGNQLPYSDVLVPTTRTNATQQLTIGDTSNITGMVGLPIQTTSSGVIGALLIFKATQIWQVTGDTASSDLAQNYLSLTVGTEAPRSIAQSPLGIYFANTGGPYVIDMLGEVYPVVHGNDDNEPDLQVPFQNITQATRVAVGYVPGLYRVCMDTVVNGTSGRYDFWFDERKRRWTGPHTFTYDCAAEYQGNFLIVSNANTGKIFQSNPIPTVNSTYSDNGVTISPLLLSATFPKVMKMTEKQVVECTQELSSSEATTTYTVTAQDEVGNILGSTTIPIAVSGALWGSFIWGAVNWASGINIPRVYNVYFSQPLVFKKLALQITAPANAALAIGTFFARYQDTGYTNSYAIN